MSESIKMNKILKTVTFVCSVCATVESNDRVIRAAAGSDGNDATRGAMRDVVNRDAGMMLRSDSDDAGSAPAQREADRIGENRLARTVEEMWAMLRAIEDEDRQDGLTAEEEYEDCFEDSDEDSDDAVDAPAQRGADRIGENGLARAVEEMWAMLRAIEDEDRQDEEVFEGDSTRNGTDESDDNGICWHESEYIWPSVGDLRNLAGRFDEEGLPTSADALYAARDWLELQRMIERGELEGLDEDEVARVRDAIGETQSERRGREVTRLFDEKVASQQRGAGLERENGMMIGPRSGRRWGSVGDIRHYARYCDEHGHSTDPKNVTNDVAFAAARDWTEIRRMYRHFELEYDNDQMVGDMLRTEPVATEERSSELAALRAEIRGMLEGERAAGRFPLQLPHEGDEAPVREPAAEVAEDPVAAPAQEPGESCGGNGVPPAQPDVIESDNVE
jgi:hypothetical protein